jgi:hypothetical protein
LAFFVTDLLLTGLEDPAITTRLLAAAYRGGEEALP